MKSIRFFEKDAGTWNAFNASAKNGLFLFDRRFMDYHKDRFEDHSLLFYDDDEDGELVALLPLSIKGDVLYSHGGLTFGGFITGASMRAGVMLECFDELMRYMRENQLKKLVYKAVPHIYHSYPAEEDLYALFRNHATLLKVEPSTTIPLGNAMKFSRGRKVQVQCAKKQGVQVAESLDFERFIALENEVLAQRHAATAVHTGAELELLHSRFPENVRLFTAEYQGELVAGTLVFEYPQVVHTQYLVANETARKIGALDLVIATLIERYRETKRYFDFGISTEDGGRGLNEGLILQKETFGGRTTVHQTFELEV